MGGEAGSGWSQGLTRRGLLRLGVGSATALVAGSMLVGCSTGGSGAANPTTGSQKTKIVFNSNLSFSGYSIPQSVAFMQEILKPFFDANPKIGVTITVDSTVSSETGLAKEVAGGTLADVFHTYAVPTPQMLGTLIANLSPYITADNLDLSIFSTGQLNLYKGANGNLYGLPMYLGTIPVLINRTMLNQINQSMPAPNWTYADWQALAEAATNTSKKTFGVCGMLIEWIVQGQLAAFGGSFNDPTNPAVCTLNSPGSIKAYKWYSDGYKNGWFQWGSGYGNPFFNGQSLTAFFQSWTFGGKSLNSLYRMADNWDLIPLPSNPPLPAMTPTTSDYYAMSPATKEKEASWTLLKYLATSTTYVQNLMKTSLYTPAIKSLWPNYVSLVHQVAPFTVGKNIGAFGVQAEANEAIPNTVFPYSNTQASGLIGKAAVAMRTTFPSVTQTLDTLTTQINALEVAGAKEAGSSTKAG